MRSIDPPGPPRPPWRVVFLLQDLLHGGTQTQTLELARRLPRDRYSPEIWTLTGAADLEADPLPRRAFGAGSRVGPRALFRLRRRLAAEPPDLLVLLTVVPNLWGRLLVRGTPVRRVVGTCRSGEGPWRQHERILWPLADRIVCNSREIVRVLVGRCGVPNDRVLMIPNGVDAGRFSPLPAPDRPVILCVARLAPDKDHANLLRAFDLVRRRRPDAELVLIGDGPLRHRVRAALAHREGVRWSPAAPDLRVPLRDAWVFVLPSRREGTPNAALEAMAAARPVVATAVGGLPDLVHDRTTGRLVAAGDAESLAGALLDILGDRAAAERMGVAGRRIVVENYPMDAMVRAHDELFRTLMEQPSRQGPALQILNGRAPG